MNTAVSPGACAPAAARALTAAALASAGMSNAASANADRFHTRPIGLLARSAMAMRSVLASLVRAGMEARARRRAWRVVKDLDALDDRALRDVGLVRGDLYEQALQYERSRIVHAALGHARLF